MLIGAANYFGAGCGSLPVSTRCAGESVGTERCAGSRRVWQTNIHRHVEPGIDTRAGRWDITLVLLVEKNTMGKFTGLGPDKRMAWAACTANLE